MGTVELVYEMPEIELISIKNDLYERLLKTRTIKSEDTLGNFQLLQPEVTLTKQ